MPDPPRRALRDHSPMHALFLLCAGALAGTIGAAGGITSLVSYPALLLVGLPALSANVVNNVAYVAALPGSALGSRPELHGRTRWLRHWAPLVAAGGALGAALLLATPPGVFARVVPFLVLIGALAMLVEPRLASWFERRAPQHAGLALALGMLPLSLYLGYFGAGSGVMLLTLLLVVAEHHLPTANALKNILLGSGAICTSIVLVLFARVAWGSVLPLGAGILIGSRLGPALARRVPVRVIRPLITLLGVALAVQLWLHPGA